VKNQQTETGRKKKQMDSTQSNRNKPDVPQYRDVIVAATRIQGWAHRTPVMTSKTANATTGAELFFKCENLQRAGAFKFRGAFNAIAALTDAQRASGVVTFSSGNHAQAIALAGSLQRVATTIIMPKDAPEMKVAATRGYGGNIVFYDRYTEDRDELGRKLSQERGMSLIPPYDHAEVIAGQATATKELLEQEGPLDRLFVPLGGGGLLAGAALAAQTLSPHCKVIGVEPAAGNDGQLSFRSGKIVNIAVPKSLADGALVTHVGEINFSIIRSLVHDIITVPDEALIEAMKFFAERMKILVEPTGCLAAAAVFSQQHHQKGERIGILLSGGNVDLKRFAALLG
jgi:threonine dehydratase